MGDARLLRAGHSVQRVQAVYGDKGRLGQRPVDGFLHGVYGCGRVLLAVHRVEGVEEGSVDQARGGGYLDWKGWYVFFTLFFF